MRLLKRIQTKERTNGRAFRAKGLIGNQFFKVQTALRERLES